MSGKLMSGCFAAAGLLLTGTAIGLLYLQGETSSEGAALGAAAPRLKREAAVERAIVAAREIGMQSDRSDDLAAALMSLGEYEVLIGNPRPAVPPTGVTSAGYGAGEQPTAAVESTVPLVLPGTLPIDESPLPEPGRDPRQRVWVVTMKGQGEWAGPGSVLPGSGMFDYVTVLFNAASGDNLGVTASPAGNPLPLDLPGTQLDERRVVPPAPEPMATLSDQP